MPAESLLRTFDRTTYPDLVPRMVCNKANNSFGDSNRLLVSIVLFPSSGPRRCVAGCRADELDSSRSPCGRKGENGGCCPRGNVRATWRPVDRTTWAKSAGRQVGESKGRHPGRISPRRGRSTSRPTRPTRPIARKPRSGSGPERSEETTDPATRSRAGQALARELPRAQASALTGRRHVR